MKIGRGKFSAFVPAGALLIPKDFFKLVTGKRACGMQFLEAAEKVEIHENFGQVEQNCFNLHPCMLTPKTEYCGAWQYEHRTSTRAAASAVRAHRNRLSGKLNISTACQKRRRQLL